jgi:hypothetical protein
LALRETRLTRAIPSFLPVITFLLFRCSGASNRRQRQRKRKWIDVVSDELIVEISPHSQSSSSSPWSSSASLPSNSTTQDEDFLTKENVEHALMKFSKPNRVRILTTSQKAIASYWTVEVQIYKLNKENEQR